MAGAHLSQSAQNLGRHVYTVMNSRAVPLPWLFQIFAQNGKCSSKKVITCFASTHRVSQSMSLARTNGSDLLKSRTRQGRS